MPVALVTGVSRARGIAAATAERLRTDGFTVVTEPDQPQRLLEEAESRAGLVTALVLAHAFDSDGSCSSAAARRRPARSPTAPARARSNG